MENSRVYGADTSQDSENRRVLQLISRQDLLGKREALFKGAAIGIFSVAIPWLLNGYLDLSSSLFVGACYCITELVEKNIEVRNNKKRVSALTNEQVKEEETIWFIKRMLKRTKSRVH